MSKTGKILLIARSFPPPDGGAERRYANLCRSFPEGSIEVCTSRRDGQEEFDGKEPYPVHRMRERPLRERRATGFARWTGWAMKRVARGDVGLIWVGDLRPIGRLGWILRRLTGVPYAISFYGWDLTSELARPGPLGAKGLIGRKVLNGASSFLANSQHIARKAEEHARQVGARPPGERLHVILSGADGARFRADVDPIRARAEFGIDGGKTILTAARLIPEKGLAAGIDAFARVARDHPDALYVIAGTGAQEEELRELARRRGVEDRVRFLGAVPYPRMPLLHAAADVFLLPSRSVAGWTENFPNACLEAMATGRPVIAGKVGGVPEMVVDGVTGLLVDPESPSDIAAALTRLLSDAALRASMGGAGRERVERELTHARAAREIYALFTAASRLPLPSWRAPEA
jgi:phosphatidylinositol alpha-1,6-mannosyltransferase